jgi:hypothetical protein
MQTYVGPVECAEGEAVTASAYPKGIERLATLSYPQLNEDPSKSSDDDEDEVSSSVSGPNDSGSSSDEESSQTDSDSKSDYDSSCDDPKSKKRSKAKAKLKYTHSKKLNKPKKCKTKKSKKKSTLKTKSKKTTKRLELTVDLDLGKTVEGGDLYWQRVSNDPERRMVSNSGGDFVFYVKYQNIIDKLKPEDIGQFNFWLANITQVSHQKKLHNQTIVGMRQHCCISALQDLIMEGKQHAPDQFNHMDRHYERHLDDIGAPREIWMHLSEHHKKGSKCFGEQTLKAAREYRKDLVNKAVPHWYCGSGSDFHECFTNCTHVWWAQTSNQNNASAKSKGQLEKYNANIVPVDFVSTIMFSMLDPRLSKGVINNTRNRGPSVVGNDGACTQTNFKNHEYHATTKRKKEKIIFKKKEREDKQLWMVKVAKRSF